MENYDTSLREVRPWLARAIGVLAHPGTAWPVYVHCTSGRDRTGLVVAAALLLLGLPREVIVEEFLLSDGAERSLIEGALAGIVKAQATFGVDVPGLHAALLRRAAAGAHPAAVPGSPSTHDLSGPKVDAGGRRGSSSHHHHHPTSEVS